MFQFGKKFPKMAVLMKGGLLKRQDVFLSLNKDVIREEHINEQWIKFG